MSDGLQYVLQAPPPLRRARQATGLSDMTQVDDSPIPTSVSACAPTATPTPTPTPTAIAGHHHHHRRTVRCWIVCCLSFLFCVPVLAVMLGLHVHARDFSYTPGAWVPTFPGRTVQLELVLVDADPKARLMTMDWMILGERSTQCSRSSLKACTDVDIFFDGNLLETDTSVFRTNNRPTDPLFRLNATALAVNDPVANTATFRTHVALFSPGNKQSSLIYYPFDTYSAEIFVFAQDSVTKELVGLEIVRTRGIATGFKTLAVSGPDTAIPAGMVDILIEVHRGNLVKSFSIVATIAIWMITLILLLVMLTCVFFGFRQKSEVLCIPVGTLFAFTQLRSSMPGAPDGFGDILDFVGLLPCLALLSLSAAITLAAFITSDPTEKPQMLSWEMLFEAFPRLDYRKHEKAIEEVRCSEHCAELGTGPGDQRLQVEK